MNKKLMKVFYAFIAALFIAPGMLTIQAQTANTMDNGTRVAIVYTEKFRDHDAGIVRIVNAFKALDLEFKPRRDEIDGLKAKYDEAASFIHHTDEKVLADKAERAKTLMLDIKRKQEDAQRAFDRRVKQLINPIYAEVINTLQIFARQQGIDIVIDASKLVDSMIVINNSVDITESFISFYNKNNLTGVPVK